MLLQTDSQTHFPIAKARSIADANNLDALNDAVDDRWACVVVPTGEGIGIVQVFDGEGAYCGTL